MLELKHPQIQLRCLDATTEDQAFIRRLYASVKDVELLATGWNESQKIAYIDTQFAAQLRAHGALPNLQQLLVLYKNDPVGRIYLRQIEDSIVLVDLSLIKGFRGQGLGSLLLAALIDKANKQRLSIDLNIEKRNPALKWFLRMNFQLLEDKGVYLQLRRLALPTE